MSRNALLALLALAVVGIAVVVSSPWSSGESHSKASLLSKVSNTLEDHGAPPPFTHCVIRYLDANLTEAEVQRSYAAMPSGSNASSLAVLDFGQAATAQVAQASLLCTQRLVRSGKFTEVELMRMLSHINR